MLLLSGSALHSFPKMSVVKFDFKACHLNGQKSMTATKETEMPMVVSRLFFQACLGLGVGGM